MKVIHKYQLPIQWGLASIDFPETCRILSCQVQDRYPTLWVEVDRDEYLRRTEFQVMFTGDEAPEGASYLATLQDHGLVMHVYIELDK